MKAEEFIEIAKKELKVDGSNRKDVAIMIMKGYFGGSFRNMIEAFEEKPSVLLGKALREVRISRAKELLKDGARKIDVARKLRCEFGIHCSSESLKVVAGILEQL